MLICLLGPSIAGTPYMRDTQSMRSTMKTEQYMPYVYIEKSAAEILYKSANQTFSTYFLLLNLNET